MLILNQRPRKTTDWASSRPRGPEHEPLYCRAGAQSSRESASAISRGRP